MTQFWRLPLYQLSYTGTEDNWMYVEFSALFWPPLLALAWGLVLGYGIGWRRGYIERGG